MVPSSLNAFSFLLRLYIYLIKFILINPSVGKTQGFFIFLILIIHIVKILLIFVKNLTI